MHLINKDCSFYAKNSLAFIHPLNTFNLRLANIFGVASAKNIEELVVVVVKASGFRYFYVLNLRANLMKNLKYV